MTSKNVEKESIDRIVDYEYKRIPTGILEKFAKKERLTLISIVVSTMIFFIVAAVYLIVADLTGFGDNDGMVWLGVFLIAMVVVLGVFLFLHVGEETESFVKKRMKIIVKQNLKALRVVENERNKFLNDGFDDTNLIEFRTPGVVTQVFLNDERGKFAVFHYVFALNTREIFLNQGGYASGLSFSCSDLIRYEIYEDDKLVFKNSIEKYSKLESDAFDSLCDSACHCLRIVFFFKERINGNNLVVLLNEKGVSKDSCEYKFAFGKTIELCKLFDTMLNENVDSYDKNIDNVQDEILPSDNKINEIDIETTQGGKRDEERELDSQKFENNRSGQHLNRTEDEIAVLKKLKEMLDCGLITEADYENKKAEILKNL